MSKRNNGFTLIEIILVVILISVVSAVAIPSVFTYVSSSKKKIDTSLSLEMQNCINTLLSSDVNSNYSIEPDKFLLWTSATKTALRNIISEELDTGSLISIPQQPGYAFFAYLLPPYTVVALPISTPSSIDTESSSSLISPVTTDFLSKRYRQNSYPQLYVPTLIDGTYQSSIKIPTVLNPQTSDWALSIYLDDHSDLRSNFIGCLNIPGDF